MVAQIQMLFTSLKTETDLRRNAEMKQLQAQINPHFLYNSLFFIMSMAKSSPEAVIRMSKHLAEYYRYLTRLDSSSVTLATELELADHYLGIMALCKTMDYDIKLPDELKEQPIMPLIIQPIVENAILHGIEERQGAHRVAISVEGPIREPELRLPMTGSRFRRRNCGHCKLASKRLFLLPERMASGCGISTSA